MTTQLPLALPALDAPPQDEDANCAPSAKPQTPQEVAKQIAFVQSPIILHRGGGWETDVPDWMRDALPAARLKYLLAGGSPDLACEFDAVIYLMGASLEQPLGSEWTRIYLHVAFKAIRELGREIPDDDWVRDAEKPISPYERQMLDHLREQIRRAQVKHAARQNAKHARRA